MRAQCSSGAKIAQATHERGVDEPRLNAVLEILNTVCTAMVLFVNVLHSNVSVELLEAGWFIMPH